MENIKYYRELDGIRGIAALMVMVFHFVNSGNYPSYIVKLSTFGQTGVTLFFVLSGFLITRILIQTKHSNNYFKIFYIRRSLRIFPLYFFFLLIYYTITPLIQEDTVGTNEPTWYYWCFLQNVPLTFNWPNYGPDHYWSLAVEEHFYLILPFVIFLCNKKQLLKFLYITIVLALLTKTIFTYFNYTTYYFTLTTMDALAMGALLAYYETEHNLEKKENARAVYLILILLPLLIFIWIFVSSKAIAIVQILKFSIIAFIYLLFIVYSISTNPKNYLKKFLMSFPIQYAGKISYGLYVYHPICFLIIQKYLGFKGYLIDFITSFGLAFLFASLSYHLFEVKVLSLKKHFNYLSDGSIPVSNQSNINT